MGGRRAWTRLASAVVLAAWFAAVLGMGTARADGNADIRGTWHWVSLANGTRYPQDVTVTTEDLSTGAFSGTDVGAGQTFSVMGTVTGASFTVTISEPGYTADATGTVQGSGDQRTWTGSFHDSNSTSGTYTATFVRTTPTPAASAGGGTSRDLRGSWDCVSHAGGTDYPQTLHITDEDMASGAISGTDVDTRNQTYTLQGTASADRVAMTITLASAGYVSRSQGLTVSGSGTALAMNGTFLDNNNTTGVFECHLAVPAAAAAAQPTATPGGGAQQAAVSISGGSGSGWWTLGGISLAVLVAAGGAAAVTVRRLQARRMVQPSLDQLDPPEVRADGDDLSPRV